MAAAGTVPMNISRDSFPNCFAGLKNGFVGQPGSTRRGRAPVTPRPLAPIDRRMTARKSRTHQRPSWSPGGGHRSSGPPAVQLPVLSQHGEISLAETLVNPPEDECEHDRTSLIEAMDNGASFQQGFAGCRNWLHLSQTEGPVATASRNCPNTRTTRSGRYKGRGQFSQT
jgi:hypothetical protein